MALFVLSLLMETGYRSNAEMATEERQKKHSRLDDLNTSVRSMCSEDSKAKPALKAPDLLNKSFTAFKAIKREHAKKKAEKEKERNGRVAAVVDRPSSPPQDVPDEMLRDVKGDVARDENKAAVKEDVARNETKAEVKGKTFTRVDLCIAVLLYIVLLIIIILAVNWVRNVDADADDGRLALLDVPWKWRIN